jgi:hypothetical protein
MAQLNVPSFTIDEALQRGYDIWELFFKDWGFSSDNLQWPPVNTASINPSLAGVSIGPKSTVDRVWVSYNLQKLSPDIPIDSGIVLTNRLREVSVDSPLIFTQPSNEGKASTVTDPVITMNKFGSLYVYSHDNDQGLFPNTHPPVYLPIVNSTVYGDFSDVNGVSRSLGEAATFVGPYLHLICYLKSPNIIPPLKRAPLTAGALTQVNGGGEHAIAQIATFGRRTIHICLIADQPTSFRIGALRVSSDGSLYSGYTTQEEPVDSALNVAANTPVVLTPCSQTEVKADYLNIYATLTQPNTNIKWSLTAYD